MDIRGQTVMVLGGWGLVGSAIAREMVSQGPARVVLTSLEKWQVDDAVAQMRLEFPDAGVEFTGESGDIFARTEFKDLPREQVLGDPERRRRVMRDLLNDLDSTVLEASFLNLLLRTYRPQVIVDCINSATSFAYQDVYKASLDVSDRLDEFEASEDFAGLKGSVERLLCTSYTPQLIRHVQILYQSMVAMGTRIYVKIGTSGTGGMGLNIPYTHSEEKPSRMLLSKSAVAGAHTMLLFLMARTPNGPIIKEFKPTALIGWKTVAYGPIKKRGKPVRLFDMSPAQAVLLEGKLTPEPPEPLAKFFASQGQKVLESVYIDTGENGIFTSGEFEAVTTIGQMQFITPEEIASSVVYEIRGGNTGHDVINALDQACMGPTYRAGAMRHGALEKMRELEEKHNCRSAAFELLGPPKLSKMLWEAELMYRIDSRMEALVQTPAATLSAQLTNLISSDLALRSQILSIGLPILMADGKRLLRGPEMHVPVFKGRRHLDVTPASVNRWAADGWVDLRVENCQRWIDRFQTILSEVERIPPNDTSSRYHRNRDFWLKSGGFNIGKVAGWICIQEEKGLRMKS